MSTPPPEAGLYLGQKLGDWNIIDFLAPGGFALVFSAQSSSNGKQAAVKILSQSASPEDHQEFASEGDMLNLLLNASSVVDVLDVGAEPIIVKVLTTGVSVPITARFIVLELASGCLEELLVNRAQLAWSERLAMYRGVVRGVHQMHLNEVVHRDLKSSNCLLFVDNQQVASKVSDLGRSRNLRQGARFPAVAYAVGRGDLRFAAPELLWHQGSDNPDVWKRADLYGLGSLLFEIATGQGITGVALGSGVATARALASMPAHVRASQYASQIGDLRARYAIAHDMFANELPASIRNQAVALLRQLCDPDPQLRLPTIAPGRRKSVNDGLEWLIRRIDILIKTLHKAELQAAHLAKKKGQEHVANV